MTLETQSTSPAGRYQLQVEPWEAGNSHWVMSPQVVDTTTDKVLFKFSAHAWSAEQSTWESDALVRVELRKYPGNQPRPCLVVRLDCLREMGAIDGGEFVPLAALEPLLERALLGAP